MEWKNDILSFSGFNYGVSTRKQVDNTASKVKDDKPRGIEEEIERTKAKNTREEKKENVLKDFEFEPMNERKIENTYFQNIEQAEKKMNKLTKLKSKWAELGKDGDSITSKMYLKPLSHKNPWKDREFQQKELNQNSNANENGKCIIS
uniref:Uncharacterized protein n=1 Tax=Caenorhabditis japonica TaxID=281687 RepID=A0A8R1ILR9_CAEJA